MVVAAVCRSVGAPLEIGELELAAPGPHEVEVRLAASGVCHSDLSVQNGTLPQPFPLVLGHEGAGIIERVGSDVTAVEVGDPVVISWVPQCGECFFCAHDQWELCEVGSPGLMTGGLLDGTSRFRENGTTVYQMANAGTFAHSTVVPEIGVVKIDPDIPLTRAALIGCSVLTGFGAAVHTADISRGDTVAVIGCGGVGLNVIQGAVYAGAARIVAIDRIDAKLDLARSFGATDTFNAARVDVTEAVLELSAGRGVDVAFEVIGLTTTLAQALTLTRRGGQTIAVGVAKVGATMEIDPAFDLVMMEKRLIGCWYGGANVARDIPFLAGLYRDGVLKLDELISHQIALGDVNQAFAALEAGTVARTLITY